MPVKRYFEIHDSPDIPRQISVDIQWRYYGVSLYLTYRYEYYLCASFNMSQSYITIQQSAVKYPKSYEIYAWCYFCFIAPRTFRLKERVMLDKV